MSQPHTNPADGPQLERALQPGHPEFEEYRARIQIDQLVAMEAVQSFNGVGVEITARVKNNTGRTIRGLEMRGAILDRQDSVVHERKVVLVPARQTILEIEESINVRILLEGMRKDADRAIPVLEVTAIRFDS
ncbi:MAG TPA: hypothetical protein VF251_03610 [Pyrinomonadaceae bacterium]